MLDTDDQKRKDAMKALINLAMLEGFALIAVVAVYLATNRLAYLIGGLAGVIAIFAPFFVRWALANKNAIKAKPNRESEIE